MDSHSLKFFATKGKMSKSKTVAGAKKAAQSSNQPHMWKIITIFRKQYQQKKNK